MKTFVGFIMFFAVFSGLNAEMLKQKTTYQVAVVTRVISPLEFECKLKDYSYAKAARFRVQMQNLKLIENAASDEQAVLFLQEVLGKANTIQLRNVKSRNYFRLSADVFVDDSSLLQVYVDHKLATVVDLPKEDNERAPNPSRPSTQPGRIQQSKRNPAYQVASQSAVPARRVPASPNRKYVSMQDLLDAQVDLSVISDDTPLSEALDVIAHSVQPNLPLVILWKDLESNTLIDKDTPVGVSGFGQMRLGLALKTVLDSVSNSQYDVVLTQRENILLLGTRQGLQYGPITRVYSITDLTAAPSPASEYSNNYGSASRGNSSGRSGNSNSGSSNRRY